jgi:hypothetical protein
VLDFVAILLQWKHWKRWNKMESHWDGKHIILEKIEQGGATLRWKIYYTEKGGTRWRQTGMENILYAGKRWNKVEPHWDGKYIIPEKVEPHWDSNIIAVELSQL